VTTPYQRNGANGHVSASRNGHATAAVARVRGSGRATAERLHREGVQLTTRELAARSGCSPTTAWRGIKSFQASSTDKDKWNAPRSARIAGQSSAPGLAASASAPSSGGHAANRSTLNSIHSGSRSYCKHIRTATVVTVSGSRITVPCVAVHSPDLRLM
jgi:hypothetical protein